MVREELAAAGAHVAIWDRSGAAAQAARSAAWVLRSMWLVNRALRSHLLSRWHRRPDLRLLVNCAGIGGASLVAGPKGTHSLDLFRSILDVNLTGSLTLAMARASYGIRCGGLVQKRVPKTPNWLLRKSLAAESAVTGTF